MRINKDTSPGELLLKLLDRSTCSVQVAACLVDKHGFISWGINHSGPDGYGEHAERMCLKRANPKRVSNATMYVMARRKKSGSYICAKPCPDCWPVVKQCKDVYWRDKGTNKWCVEHPNSRA